MALGAVYFPVESIVPQANPPCVHVTAQVRLEAFTAWDKTTLNCCVAPVATDELLGESPDSVGGLWPILISAPPGPAEFVSVSVEVGVIGVAEVKTENVVLPFATRTEVPSVVAAMPLGVEPAVPRFTVFVTLLAVVDVVDVSISWKELLAGQVGKGERAGAGVGTGFCCV